MVDQILDSIKKLYGDNSETQVLRYRNLYSNYETIFGKDEHINFISTPGRTELSGNHTDHNGGKVIAASIDLDTIGCFSRIDDFIKVVSDGYKELFSVDLNDLQVNEEEKETSTALIRGIAAGFAANGYKIGGFNAVVTSDVLVGSGLSSSASFEVMIGSILNYLYNNNEILPAEIAKIGQFAENKYFGKPCGLMDQVACAVGGIVSIDFKTKENPIITHVNFNLAEFRYKLVVVDTGGTHHNLTPDYAAIPEEMKEVAAFFKKENCSQVEYDHFFQNIPSLRGKVSDRAILRASHFFNENKRVVAQMEALKNNDLKSFLELVTQSGNSSFKYLQNIYSPANYSEQSVALALSMSEEYIMKIGEGACRVHGGGFAGTIQVFLPQEFVEDFKNLIEPVFGNGSVKILNIRLHSSIVL